MAAGVFSRCVLNKGNPANPNVGVLYISVPS